MTDRPSGPEYPDHRAWDHWLDPYEGEIINFCLICEGPCTHDGEDCE